MGADKAAASAASSTSVGHGHEHGLDRDDAAAAEDDDDDDTDEQDARVTPHQYQIQLRWNNEDVGPDGKTVAPPPRPLRLGSGGNVDKMGERVRDRLFEHREEEHWHDKKWLKANDKASATDSSKPASLVGPGQLDFGPNQRDTPIRDQLPHWATHGQERAHFAIPTQNFRQSSKFVEWAQRGINMSEWPDEPRKQ